MGAMKTRVAEIGVWAFIAFCSSVGASHAEVQSFPDPAPPTVADLAPMAPPSAQANADLTFHAAPKPLPTGAVTQEWASFLGPNHNAVCNETRILHHFPKGGPALVWEVKKGSGYSAPAVAGGRVVLLHRVGDVEAVDCLEAETGKRFWRFTYPTEYQDRFGYCHGPRSSPVIDGDRAYAYGAEGKVHCLKLETGQLIWQRDLSAEFKLKQNFFGVGSSPLVEGKYLIINVGADGGPCVAAFDKMTGKLAWGAGDRWGPSYATPVPADVLGKRRLFVFAGGESRPATGGLLCIDPANGAVDFTFPWRSRSYESVNASSPLILGSQVFISECYGAGGALLDLSKDAAGGIEAKPAWTSLKLGTHFMTAIEKDGYLYGVDGHGPLDAPLVCVDLKTGDEMWRKDVNFQETFDSGSGPHKQEIGLARATLLNIEGQLLCLGEYGHLLWLEPSPKGYKELDRAWLFAAGESWSPPVLSHGLLYVCQNTSDALHKKGTRLLCYDLRE